ncbi:unnamed protein product [Alopecurus aequalis]
MGHAVIDDKEDDFEVSGPTHMRSNGADSQIVTDWDNAEHRRCVMACLVKGTCVMENDRLKCRSYNDVELAPAWWKNLGFERIKAFVYDGEENHQFTYGAIFKLMAPSPFAPKYVIAFRGTMLSHPKMMEELLEDFWVVFNALANYPRFKRAHPEVDSLICSSPSVWLAGHSLGASMALEIGRNLMLEKGRNIPTFLFNPPHVSPAAIIAEECKTLVYTVSFIVKFGLANMMPGYHQRTKKLFQQLAPWVPDLYVNPDDLICRGFIDYFMQRQLVCKDYPRYANTAARGSYRDMFFSIFSDKTQPHLLPSARLWTSSSHSNQAHQLRQWWKSDTDLALSMTLYSYPLNDAEAEAGALLPLQKAHA